MATQGLNEIIFPQNDMESLLGRFKVVEDVFISL